MLVRRALALLVWAPVVGCRALVDPGVSYRGCELTDYAEDFLPGSTMKDLYERCWQLDNASDVENDVRPFEDDLVMKVGDGQTWDETHQGPLFYQELAHDFLVAVRVEAINKVNASHCNLEPDNLAGLALRRKDTPTEWATFLIGPFTPPPPNAGFDCSDASTMALPTRAVANHGPGRWGDGFEETGVAEGIGRDGEADIAICRVGSALTYYYGDPSVPPDARPVWIPSGDMHTVDPGAMEVGLTVSGMAPTFLVEGHFDWAIITDSLPSDGCTAAFSRVTFPMHE